MFQNLIKIFKNFLAFSRILQKFKLGEIRRATNESKANGAGIVLLEAKITENIANMKTEMEANKSNKGLKFKKIQKHLKKKSKIHNNFFR